MEINTLLARRSVNSGQLDQRAQEQFQDIRNFAQAVMKEVQNLLASHGQVDVDLIIDNISKRAASKPPGPPPYRKERQMAKRREIEPGLTNEGVTMTVAKSISERAREEFEAGRRAWTPPFRTQSQATTTTQSTSQEPSESQAKARLEDASKKSKELCDLNYSGNIDDYLTKIWDLNEAVRWSGITFQTHICQKLPREIIELVFCRRGGLPNSDGEFFNAVQEAGRFHEYMEALRGSGADNTNSDQNIGRPRRRRQRQRARLRQKNSRARE